LKLPPFTLHRPGSIGQASRLLADLGDEGAAYCGGTELLLAMKLGLASYEHLVDLKRVDALRGIEPIPATGSASGGGIRIGAASTHREIETSAVLHASYPELCAMISQVANVRVRSVGTLGGNLCFADPHSDPASFLLAAGAVFTCQRGQATRRIPAAAFFTGLYQTALAPGELLTAVELPARPDRAALSHVRFKLTERPAVTVSAMLTLAPGEGAARAVAGSSPAAGGAARAVAGARLIVGSVGSVPFAAGTAVLAGATAGDFETRAAECAGQAAAGCAPLPDGEAAEDYLRHLVFLHARQALWEAFTRASQPR
jgi:carbon-monoxide dehydrogenase medium subunit